MKRLIMAACSASLLMLGTSAFAQSSGAMGNNSMSKGAMAASEPMAASGTMAKKPMKHQKKMTKKEDSGMGMGNHASGTSAN